MKNALFSYHTFMIRHQLLRNTEKSNFFQLVSHTKQYKDCGGTRHYYFNIPGCSFFLRCADLTFPVLEIIINPIRLLGSDSHTKIFDPSAFSFIHVENKMNEILQSLGFSYQFRDFNLVRLDLCVNLQMETHDEVEAYLKVIQKTKLPRYFEQVSFPDTYKNHEGKNEHSFRIEGPGVSFTVYDKSYQMEDRNLLPNEEDEPNLLRFELALESKSIQNLQSEYRIDDTAEFLDAIHLNGICEKMFGEIIPMVFMDCPYHSFSEAEKLLEQRITKPKSLESALQFLECLSRCKSMVRAIQLYVKDTCGGSYKRFHKVLKDFEKAGVNPVTIPEEYLPHRDKSYSLKSVPELMRAAMVL